MSIKYFLAKILLFTLLFCCLYTQEDNMTDTTNNSIIEKSFGSFLLPNDWVEISRYSKNGKYFYAHESEEIGLNMTNISIEMGTNRYLLEEHIIFRYEIQRQLLIQSQRAGGTGLYGSGTFTKNDDPLYIFTIQHKDRNGVKDVTTIQYYIIGNKKHILIHVTDFHNDTTSNVEETARAIADSFKWAE